MHLKLNFTFEQKYIYMLYIKKITLSIIVCFASILCLAQAAQVSGTVTDEQGKAVPFALVKDIQHNNATFSAPDGSFSLATDPSSLVVSAKNYKKIKVSITDRSNIKVV